GGGRRGVGGGRGWLRARGSRAETAASPRRVERAGGVGAGPRAAVIETMGDKVAGRRAMVAAGVPVAAGTTEPVTDLAAAEQAAELLGYPLMVKAAAGGGGIGMSAVTGPDPLRAAFDPPHTPAPPFP